MSLIILSVDRITDVLPADGWHDVADGSFEVDTYEYYDYREPTTTLAALRRPRQRA